jgi:hypothetical protein
MDFTACPTAIYECNYGFISLSLLTYACIYELTRIYACHLLLMLGFIDFHFSACHLLFMHLIMDFSACRCNFCMHLPTFQLVN